MIKKSSIREALDILNNLEETTRTFPKKEVLDEDLRGYFKNQYLKKFATRNNLEGEEKDILKQALPMALAIAKLDPTFKGKDIQKDEEALNQNQGTYFDWLIRLINKGATTYEDMMNNAHEYSDQLQAFDNQKKRNRIPADKKDIMQYKTLDELMHMLMDLGAADAGSETHSDFKQDIRDIRQGLVNICKFRNESNIPASIKSVDDVLNLIGENNEWEVWEAKNKYGTMLFDRWGKGAGWCVGGMLGSPRDGEEQADWADRYFKNYNAGGRASYVCFQRKDKNASRPDNKYLITLGPDGSRPDNGWAGYQFNDANNSSVYYRYDHDRNASREEQEMDALAQFLKENNLVDIIRNSKFKGVEALNVVDNMERLEKGEPFIYNGGKIRDVWKNRIKKLVFNYDGKEYEVDVKEHPEYLNGESANDMINFKLLAEGKPFEYSGEGKIPEKFHKAIKDLKFNYNGQDFVVDIKENPDYLQAESSNEMFNLKQLKEGKPYVYDGTTIKPLFQQAIKDVVIADDYDVHAKDIQIYKSNPATKDEWMGIPMNAFKGCTNIETITLPDWPGYCIGLHAFDSVPDTAKVIIPRKKEGQPFKCMPMDRQHLAEIFYYDDGSKVAG